MKLILISDVDALGKRGDVVDVAEGYARNFLLPRKKAVRANEGALAQAEAVREARVESERKAREDAERLATQLVGSRVVIAAQAGDEGQLYGSITSSDVVEGVKRFTGIELDRSTLEIAKPIKAIGLHEINIKLHEDVEFQLTLDVIPAT
jgi:large subunit ribosomal protein L9